MITNISGISRKFLKGNKIILFSSIMAILISTSLIIGMFNFAVKSGENFKKDIISKFGIQDILVGYEMDSNKELTKDLENKIRKIQGVEDIERIYISGYENGMIIGSSNNYMTKSRYKYSEDINTKEAVISSALKEKLSLEKGEIIDINNEEFTVKEIINVDIDITIINIDKLREIDGVKDGGTYGLLKTKGDNTIISNELKELDKDFRVEIIEEYDYYKKSQENIIGFITVFGVLILLVSSLFINSNLQNLLYRYKDQFALLRAIGGKGKDIFKILFIQGTVINGIGVTLAIIISLILKFKLIYSLLIALVIFIILEILTIVAPLKGLKVMPLQSFRANEISDFNPKRYRKLMGLAIGALVILQYIIVFKNKNGDDHFITVLISNIGLVIAFVMLMPFYINRILQVLLTKVGKLISCNRRNYLCTLIVSIAVIISVFGSGFFMVLEKNNREYLKKAYPKDITVYPQGNNIQSEILVNDIKNIKNTQCTYNYIDYVPIVKDREILDFNMKFNKELQKDEVIISSKIAEKYKIKEGDNLSIRKVEYPKKGILLVNGKIPEVNFKTELGRVKVIKINDKLPQLEFSYDGILHEDYMDLLYQYKEPTSIYIETDNIDQTKSELRELKKQYPTMRYGIYQEELAKDTEVMKNIWGVFMISIIAMIASTILGIYNMILDYLNYRRDEMSTLRALGLRKNKLNISIAQMIGVFIIVATVLGGGIGLIMTIAVV